MKIIKPLRLSIMSRPYYKKNMPYLGVSVFALVDMQKQSMLLRPEPELWSLAKNELACSNGIIDLAYPKHYAEFLVVGHAYPNVYLSENVCRVSITLGDKQKSLIVSGDRKWIGDIPSIPKPFRSIPIDWSRSYGGASVLDNPLGMGGDNKDMDCLLPNVESPTERLTFPSQIVEPAGFGPIDFTWPARQQYIGQRYDEEWVKNGALGFAEDTNPRLFNMAPLDQQWLEYSELPPSMSYKIENMHPQQPLQSGVLPVWKARCFINHSITEHSGAKKKIFSEIEMRHTTVWFIPHLEKMIFVYHGECPIEEDDAHDVHMIMPALEKVSEPRSFEHYRDVWVKRSDKEKGATYAFQDGDLLPKDAIGQWIDTEENQTEVVALQQNLAGRKQAIYQDIENGLQSIETTLPSGVKETQKLAMPKLSELPAFMAQLEKQANTAQKDAQQQLNKHIQKAKEYKNKRPTGPSSFHQMCESLRQQQHGELRANQKENLYQLYKLSVQTQDPITPLTQADKKNLRQWVMTKLSQDSDFTDSDLTGADLSYLDFSGANLTRTMMESANLSYAKFDNCLFAHTLLARTHMEKTTLRNSQFHEVTLAQSHCVQCDFTNSSLEECVTEKATFICCDFSQSHISNQVFANTLFSECHFCTTSFNNVIFNNDTELKEPNFSLAKFYKSSFIDCEMASSLFNEAEMQNCAIVDCQIPNSDFTKADVKQSAFVGSTSLNGSNFYCAQFTQCNLAKINLNNSNLQSAQFIACDFSEALLQASNLSYIQASHSLFTRTHLEGVNFEKANLMESRLKKAHLIGCNFNKANLFRADISQSIMDETTSMEDTFTHQVKIYPLYKKDKGVTS